MEMTRQRRDRRLVNPKKWREGLQRLEAEVVVNSALSEFQQPLVSPRISNVPGEISHDSNVIHGVLRNINRMREANFCGPTISALVADSSRPGVANLQPIQERDIRRLFDAYQDYLEGPMASSPTEATRLLRSCVTFLDGCLLAWTSIRLAIRERHIDSREILDRRLLYVSRAVSRFLDLATISYCGAHLERIDEMYLETTLGHFSIPCDVTGTSIIMARRTLRCLGGYLRDRPVWVFQTIKEASPLLSEPLYISATLHDFADVFGPVWQTTASQNSSAVLKYNVGKGFIVPWRRNSRDPILLPGEVFCHWTEDIENLEGADNFPRSYERLLIGAGKFLTPNWHCRTTQDDFTREMRAKKLCRAFGTSYPSKYRESQTVQVGFASSYGVGLNYSEEYKRREGVTLKDAVVASWTSEAEGRDIQIIKHLYGVEVSACTDNARRRSLFQILQSTTLKRYLRDHTEIKRSELEKYLQALDSDDVDSFIRRYKRNRKSFGKILAKCFEVLKGTGTDSDLCLTAFWSPDNGGIYAVQYPHVRHRWTGILADSPDTCTFAIVTNVCLELLDGDPACRDEYTASSSWSVLETSIVINPLAPLPTASDTIKQRRGAGRKSIRKTLVALPKGYKFNLGEVGTLKKLRGVGMGVVVDWSHTLVPPARAVKTFFRTGMIKIGSANWHHELILWDDRKERNLHVLIVSDKGMEVVVAEDRRRY